MAKNAYSRSTAMVICLLLACLLLLMPQQAHAVETDNQHTFLIEHRIVLHNTSQETSENIYLRVPLMAEEQPVYQVLLGERYNVKPLMEYLADGGNRYALFYIPKLSAGEKRELSIGYYVDNSTVDYEVDAINYTSHDISAVSPAYIRSEKGIESNNPYIIGYADKFLATEDNLYALAKKAFADVNLYMTYEDRHDGRFGALAALQTGKGQCRDYAALYIAVLRAMEIPARFQTGYCYIPAEHILPPYADIEGGYIDLSLLAHSWAEFYIPGAGWVIADPTFTYNVDFFGTTEKLVDWEHFAMIPESRRYLYFRTMSDIKDIEFEYRGGNISAEFDARLYLNAAYQPFIDIEGHWAKNDIMYLYNNAIIAGVDAEHFAPEQTISRAELAVMLYRMSNMQYAGGSHFKDVPKNAWYSHAVEAVYDSGLMVGRSDAVFMPESDITRAELAAIMQRLAETPDVVGIAPFRDVASSHWAATDIASLYAKGLIAGVGEGLFAPTAAVTRAEAAAMLYRVIHYQH